MSDLTNPEVYFGFLSSFWNLFFSDRDAIRGMSHADAVALQQEYQNFIEASSNLAIETIRPLHRELFVPVVLRKSTFANGPDKLRFNAGANFGAQPADTKFREGVTFVYGGLEKRSGLYYVGAPKDLAGLGSVIVNRLMEPSVMLTRDADFIFENNVIVFKEDPFTNPFIPKRLVAGADSNTEEEIVLWITDGEFDQKRLFQQYGYLFSNRKISTEAYRRLIQMLMVSYSDGPTFNILEAVVATIAGQPVTREVTEVVERVVIFGSKKIVITNASTYQVGADTELRANIVPGAVLPAGSPLTTVAQVFDSTRTPNWWTTVPALAMGREFIAADIGPLGFINTAKEVVLEPTLDLSGGTATPAQFFLTGKSEDIQKFWDLARSKATPGAGLGDLLWKRAGAVNLSGGPDFTKAVFLNPMEFLATDLIGRSTVVVKLKVNLVVRAKAFLDTLDTLRRVIPAWCSLIVIFETSIEEEFAFQNPGEPALDELGLVATEDLIAGQPQNFTGAADSFWNDLDANNNPVTKTPEALSAGIAPDTIITTLNLGDPSANTAALGSAIAAAVEEVRTTFVDTCNS